MKYLILTTLLLVGCQSKKIDRQIYQPAVLILPPNSKVITVEGVYISGPEKEAWYSGKTIENLERIISRL